MSTSKPQADVDALLMRLHEVYGEWELVEDFLLGRIVDQVNSEEDSPRLAHHPELGERFQPYPLPGLQAHQDARWGHYIRTLKALLPLLRRTM